MTRVWFTADTHFGSKRTLELSRRPFKHIEEMDEVIVNRWNEKVSTDDVVYHLGDFGDPSIVWRLNGAFITLLAGNYDTPEVRTSLEYDPRVKVVGGADNPAKLHELANVAVRSLGLPTLWLVHEPENAQDQNLFYLYGHIHQLQLVKQNGLNVGVDCHQFSPIGLDVIAFYYNAIVNHYDQNVFIPKLGRKG